MDARMLTSIGLSMDIVGICLLFCYGAIGGKWIESGGALLALPEHDSEGIAKNERKAKIGSKVGLFSAVVGFILQGVAQWLP